MAEKTDKKGEDRSAASPAGSAHGEEKRKAGGMGGLTKSTPALLGVAMVVEAAVLFAGFKLLGGGPKGVAGADLVTGESATSAPAGESRGPSRGGRYVELPVLDFKAPNSLRGRTLLYDISVYASVKAEAKETMAKALEERQATIKDRIRTIIAQADPDKLGGGSEPGLETLRRQVKFQLEEILGEGTIEEVLVLRCIPYRAD